MDLHGKPGLLTLLLLLAMAGCTGNRPVIKSASSSATELTFSQALDIHRILQATAQGVDAGDPIAVMPDFASGVRWSDLRQAIIDGGRLEGVTIKSTRRMDDSEATYELLTLEGWPGLLHAYRTDDGITITARVGPYPGTVAAKQRAQRLVKAIHAAMRTLGAIPKVQPYAVGTPAEGGVAK